MIIPQYLPIMPGESMASYVYRLSGANGLPLEIFTKTYMGETCTYGMLDAGFFNAERFCSSLPVKTNPNTVKKLLKDHTYNEIARLFVDKEDVQKSWCYGKYADELALGGMTLVKCPVCEKEDSAAGRPGYIHIEHCYPGANRCYRHNAPLKWRIAVDSIESDHWCKTIRYTRNNNRYMAFCLEIQKRGAFTDGERLYAGLDAAVRMLKADELYMNQAALNEEYTDGKLWDTRTGYRGYSNDRTPSFRRVKSMPEILSTLLFLFRTPENAVAYYSPDDFETPENKAALYLRLLTGDKYVLKKINAVTDSDMVFTAVHTACGRGSQFSMNSFTLGERCTCEALDDTSFLEYANWKADGFYRFSRSEAVPGRFFSCYECVRYPFSYTVRDYNPDGALTKEYILQEMNRPTLSPSFQMKSDDKLYKETFDYVEKMSGILINRMKRVKAGETFTDKEVLVWAEFKRYKELFVLNGVGTLIDRLLERAYHLNLIRRNSPGAYARVKADEKSDNDGFLALADSS